MMTKEYSDLHMPRDQS